MLMTENAETPQTPNAELRRASLEELVARLETIKADAKDYVVPVPKLEVGSVLDSRPRLMLRNEGNDSFPTSFPMTRHAETQVCEWLGIPHRYYDAMCEAGLWSLAAANLAKWIPTKGTEKRLVRTAEGRVRAVLSDRYRPLDNYDVVVTALEVAQQTPHGAKVQYCHLTEQQMAVDLVVPALAEEVRAGDLLIPGIRVSNSEVGSAALRVEPYVYRKICKNGMVGPQSLYRAHLGARLTEGEQFYSPETLRATDAAVFSQVRDYVRAGLDGTILAQFVGQLRAAAGIRVEDPIRAVDSVSASLAASKAEKAAILSAFIGEADPTLYGLAQAITRQAQEIPTEVGFTWERYAGAIVAELVVPGATATA